MKKIFAVLILLVTCCSVSAAQNHTVLLSWVASTTTGATYDVYRETSAGACTLTSNGSGPTCLKLTTVSITSTTYTDTTPLQGATSFYVIKASAPGFVSAFSNEVSVSVPLPSLNAPSGLTATVQ